MSDENLCLSTFLSYRPRASSLRHKGRMENVLLNIPKGDIINVGTSDVSSIYLSTKVFSNQKQNSLSVQNFSILLALPGEFIDHVIPITFH